MKTRFVDDAREFPGERGEPNAQFAKLRSQRRRAAILDRCGPLGCGDAFVGSRLGGFRLLVRRLQLVERKCLDSGQLWRRLPAHWARVALLEILAQERRGVGVTCGFIFVLTH